MRPANTQSGTGKAVIAIELLLRCTRLKKTTRANIGRRKKNVADTVYSDHGPCNADFKHDKDVRIAKLYIVADAVCSVNNSLFSFIFVLNFSCNSRKTKLIQGG